MGLERGNPLAPDATPLHHAGRRWRPAAGIWWLPAAIAIVGVAATFLLWRSLESVQRRQVAFVGESQAHNAAEDIERASQGQTMAFVGVAQRYGASLRDGQGWQLTLTGLRATAWADPSGKVTTVVAASDKDDHLVPADLTASPPDRNALLRARETGKPAATPSVVLPDGDSLFRVVVPFLKDGQLQGFVVAEFSAREIYSAVLRPAYAPGWAFAVFEDGQELYRRGSPAGGRWLAESRIAVLDRQRHLRSAPGPEVLARLHSPLPGVVLASGLAIAFLLAASVGFARSAQRRAREAEKAQQAVREGSARMKSVLDAALDAVIMMDSQGLVVSWNARAEALFGWSREEAVGRPLASLIIPPRYREAHIKGLARYLTTGEASVIGRRVELSALRRDGSELPVELTITVLRDGGAVLFSAFVADITERTRAQQRLAAQHHATRVLSEASTLTEAAPRMLQAMGEPLGWDFAALWTADHEGVLRCREVWRPSPGAVPTFEAATRSLGLRDGEGLPGRVWTSGEAAWISDIPTDGGMRRLEAALADGLRSAVAFPIRFEGDVVAVVEFFSRERREPDPGLSKIMTDLASQIEHFWQRRRAERNLEASEGQYRVLFDSNPQPMWVYDAETLAFLGVNDAAVRHYGYSREEFLAMTTREIRPPEEVKILDEFVARRRRERDLAPFRSPRVWKHRKKDGALIDVEIAGSPIQFQGRQAFLVLASDVTEKKRLEAQLLQSQKMESVGRLAGGVAHDFNNLLGVITGYANLLQRDLGKDHKAFGRVEEIRTAAERAAGLTRQLLAFSRKQLLEPTVLDLNLVVADIEKMLHRLIGEDIQLITVAGADLGKVKADRGQLEQVIVNLAVNARDAMPQGGKLILETANVGLDEAYAASRPDARAGPHVMLAVSDTGHGMSAETLTHMFEPFFTTKEQGKGTGLGLATVYGIVRQSGGHVMVYSEPGRGTSFKVYLPRFGGVEKASAQAPVVAEAAPTGAETILLVEDESSLRVMITEILGSAGYEVLEGPTPEEALSIAAAHPGPIPLVLTDVVLPRMSGRQLAEALRASRPDARVLFMSGYTDDAIGHHGILEPGVHFLQKPFTTDSLLRKVRDVLDSAGKPGGAP